MPVDSSYVWPEGPQKPTVPLGSIDVWRLRLDDAQLDDLSPRYEADRSVLAPDEVARASRFHFAKDRIRFTRCRSVLRHVLGRYLDVAAQGVRFNYTPAGKPELAADQNTRGLRFNVSHSDQMALIAVGVGVRLGVDIERMRADVNAAELSERFFSSRERESLRSLPESLRVAAFYACWTRKEAFLKATGEGLAFPLSDFSVSVDPEKEARLEEIRGNAHAARQWSLIDVHAAVGFRSAVAAESPALAVATFTFSV